VKNYAKNVRGFRSPKRKITVSPKFTGRFPVSRR